MKRAVENDIRFSHLTPQGVEELNVYLNWIDKNELHDTESSFVEFAIGRGSFVDGRHFFEVWEFYNSDNNIDLASRMQVLRFFMNPTDASFAISSVAGWFDFLPLAYDLIKKVPHKIFLQPTFQKKGSPITD